MLIEQPPTLYRALFSHATWRIPTAEPSVYLTFDDGPIPEITPWVLELLEKYNIKATFFCVGDNVKRNPTIYQSILSAGHHTGNHTMNHIQGLKNSPEEYLENVLRAGELIEGDLFRPPHGHITVKQQKLLTNYRTIMWDVVTRDYSPRCNGEQVLNKVKKYTRNGSIIVFHDSLKAEQNLRYALPKAIEWLLENGYQFKLL